MFVVRRATLSLKKNSTVEKKTQSNIDVIWNRYIQQSSAIQINGSGGNSNSGDDQQLNFHILFQCYIISEGTDIIYGIFLNAIEKIVERGREQGRKNG